MLQLRPHVGYRRWLADWLLGRQLVRPEEIAQHVDFECDYFGLRYKGNTANLIDAHVVYYGAYEKPQLLFLRDAAARNAEASVFWDVGANTGLYTAFLSCHVGKVHAFEPFPPMLTRLRRLVSENDLSNVVVHAVGLGETASRSPFFPPRDENLGSGSFVEGWEGLDEAAVELPIVSADQHMADAAGPTIVKIDVEGFTKQALGGMKQTLARSRPTVLLELDVGTREHEFGSLDELSALFPEQFRFLYFSFENRRTGDYSLSPLDAKVQLGNQLSVVATPAESLARLPVSTANSLAG